MWVSQIVFTKLNILYKSGVMSRNCSDGYWNIL